MLSANAFNISEKTADWLYTWGYILLIVAGLAGFVGTVWLMWGDSVKSRYSSIEIQKLKTETALANERAAGLEKEAAVARLELERLKEKSAPRVLTEEQKKAFLDRVKFEAKGSIRITAIGGDSESFQFAKQIFDLFTEAGYTVSPTIDGWQPFFQPFQVAVGGPKEYISNPPPQTIGMLSGLKAMGYVSEWAYSVVTDNSQIVVLVGPKTGRNSLSK